MNIFAAYKYAMASGMMEEKNYPTTGKKGKCPNSTNPTYFLNNVAYKEIGGDEFVLQMILLKHGPVAVLISKCIELKTSQLIIIF